jgi:hypothetical protein
MFQDFPFSIKGLLGRGRDGSVAQIRKDRPESLQYIRKDCSKLLLQERSPEIHEHQNHEQPGLLRTRPRGSRQHRSHVESPDFDSAYDVAEERIAQSYKGPFIVQAVQLINVGKPEHATR